MKYILGIDIGTSNTKAIGYTVNGTVATHANVGYSFSSALEGYHEIDPEILLDAVITVIGEAVKSAGTGPAAMSFSSAMHGLIAVDEQCHPLTNMITWADLRSNDYAEKLKDTEMGKKIYGRTGTPIHPMSPLCKLMWMKDHLPDIFRAAHKFISIKEFIFYHFFGEFIIDHSIASATGLFDIYDLDWNADALQVAEIDPGRLSRHVPVTFTINGFTHDHASKIGVDDRLPVVIGGSDGCLAHLGSHALKPHDVSITIGTSGAVRMMTPKPARDTRGGVFNYLLTDGLYIAGGPVNNGGNVLQWFNRNMALRQNPTEDYDWFVAEAVKIPPGSGGLIFLPYIYGERAPVWDANARGLFYGINGTHTQAHFMRAILEGLSFAMLGILSTLEEVVGPSGNIFASGGFIHSRDWVTILADVLGKTVKTMATEDASAAGAAIIGMKAVGLISDLTEAEIFFKVQDEYHPDMKNHQSYQENYLVYARLYDSLKAIKK